MNTNGSSVLFCNESYQCKNSFDREDGNKLQLRIFIIIFVPMFLSIRITFVRANSSYESCPINANASFRDYSLLNDYLRSGSEVSITNSSLTIGFLGSYGRSQVIEIQYLSI